jgi:CO/xanthine dehydrogenase Mo-binding subunit
MTAEALGLTSLENVKVVCSDTSVTTNTGVTAGSRSTRVAGLAIVKAVEDLKRQWFPIVAEKLGVKPEDLEFGDNRIYVKKDPSKGMSYAMKSTFFTVKLPTETSLMVINGASTKLLCPTNVVM